MLFPSISDYKEAIALSESFATLTYLTPEKGLFADVYFSSGNFAVVFKMRDSRTGKLHAVKCFTREQERRTESLGQISAYLETLQSPFIVPYTFLNDEIWVNDAEYPVLLMDWVEGVTLGEKVKTLCDARDTEGLHRLSVAFADMALALLAQDWAHGDLKHDNIIVRPDNTLALVDYDGCFVPSMSGQNAREIGSPCYRHPKRTAQHFDRHIDDFSILVIFLSLRALVNAPELLMQHHNGENMVLTTADFGNAAPLLMALRDKNHVTREIIRFERRYYISVFRRE
jgi:serine/threonine protein kinase